MYQTAILTPRKCYFSLLLFSAGVFLGMLFCYPCQALAAGEKEEGRTGGFWQIIYQFFTATPQHLTAEKTAVAHNREEDAQKTALPESKVKHYAATNAISQIVLAKYSLQEEQKITQWQKKQKPLPADYFDRVAFIGDSRTEGFLLYNGLTRGGAYGIKGLTVDDFFNKAVIPDGKGEKITIAQDIQKKNYDAFYIMLGMNELGWAYEDIFIAKYGEIIDTIAKYHPQSQIIVQSILPVSAEKSAKDPIYNNPKITRYNTLIEQMCREKGVTFLNVAEKFTDADGALFADAGTDGVHLNKEYCQMWFAYLKEQATLAYNRQFAA